MASNMYIKFTGPPITSESSATGHTDEIEVLSFSHSFNQPTSSVRSSAGAGTVEHANHADFAFTKEVDAATDDLLKMCWSGKQIATALFTCYRADGDNQPVKYLEIEMQHIVVSNFSISGGGGGIPTESVGLNYGIVKYTYIQQQKADGTPGGNQPVSHDLEKKEVA